jgi:aminopeptidase YwaD
MDLNRKRLPPSAWRLLLALLLAPALLGLLAARCAAGSGAATATQAPATAAGNPAPLPLPEFDGLMPAYRSDVERLASPEFAGRRIGEPGAELAAQYLEERLKALGVEAPPGARGYRSGFSVTRGITVTGTPAVSLNGQALALGVDYAVAAFSGSGKVDRAPVVFASYGITAPELNWDDYAGIDAQGAVVLILRGEPQEADPASAFAGDQPTVYSDLRRKAANARDHGAVALLIVDQPGKNPDDKLAEVHPQYSAASFDLPVLHMRRALVQNALIGGTGLSFAEISETIDLEGKPHSAMLTGSLFSIDVQVEKDLATGFNIVGVIPGADAALKGQYVALGAHYDHIGIGGPESLAKDSYGQVHPGADDDASGVAGVLAIAAWAMQHRSELKRSLLLCLFSGEEEGLLGASAFVKNPPVAHDSIYCLLDMDMIGRLRDSKLLLGATGTAKEFEGIISGLPQQFGLNVIQDKSGFGGSDFLRFTSTGIPSMFVFTGIHPEYHTPLDTADKVLYDGAERVLGFVTALTGRLANREGALTFERPVGGPPEQRQQTAPLSVSMGTIPSYDEEPKQPGYLVGDVKPAGPAELAGMKKGDIIIKILDRKIANIYDFMYVLQDCQPGQTVPVIVVRDGAQLEFQVTLAAKAMQQ